MEKVDAIVIGAGVIGSAVTNALIDRAKFKKVVVLEKEPHPAAHTSGRNSGVIHSGFNLKPGSMKARFCVQGNRRLREFCVKKNLPMQMVGTVVVAQSEKEVPVLEELKRRATENGTPDVKIVDNGGLKRLEPHAIGHAALHSPSGSITSGKAVTEALVADAQEKGAQFLFNHRVDRIEPTGNGFRVTAAGKVFEAEALVNCAGLYADETAHKVGVGLDYTIVPFRGQYFKIVAEKANVLNSMLYPVPDLNYPFLGVHWTRTIAGDVIIGPNATIAMGRESYKPSEFSLGDVLKMFSKRNFWNQFRSADFRKMAWEQLQISVSREKFVQEARKLIPDVSPEDFVPGKSGNRAQLVNKEGRLVDDMIVEKSGSSLHVLNAVSPGFTCSLPFADHLVDTLTAN